MTTTWIDPMLAPSREAALARIARIDPHAYARTRNHLEGAVTGLSPYLTHGLITLPEVLAGVLARHRLAIGHKLVFELGWREYFRHVWHHAGDGIMQSRQPGPRPDGAYASQMPPDIRTACTGIPVIDQAVRTLYATGTLHNHARMWLASYVVHGRRVHWRAGADWMVAHLLDGDLASNHMSWQWVAGTASHKPYLFNAENVARYAPLAWHSPGTVVDQSYEALQRLAQDPSVPPGGPTTTWAGTPTPEPDRLTAPPHELGVTAPDPDAAERLRAGPVWLVHPWALRPPPAHWPATTQVIGIFIRDYHQRWPWSTARWRWVDAAMAAITPVRWYADAAPLATLFSGSTRVQSVADPHGLPWLATLAQLTPAPTLFAAIDQPCTRFAQWWPRVTRGMTDAASLLEG